jgi:hypothetical protein
MTEKQLFDRLVAIRDMAQTNSDMWHEINNLILERWAPKEPVTLDSLSDGERVWA